MQIEELIFNLSRLEALMIYVKQYQSFGYISLVEILDLDLTLEKIKILKEELLDKELTKLQLHGLAIAGAGVIAYSELLLKHCVKKLPKEEHKRIDNYMIQKFNASGEDYE